MSLSSISATSIPPTTTSIDLRTKMAELIINALLLVAAFAWSNAFDSLINYYVPAQYRHAKNAYFKIFYALVLSVVILIAINIFLRINDRFIKKII
jgi:hypothetical protein